MRANFQTIRRFMSLMYTGIAIIAGAALLSVSPAMAQMTPGGAQQQTPSTPQSMPGTQPGQQGMSPMDQTANTNQDPNSPANMMDKAFVRQALEGGMAEVQLGQLAAQKSSNPDVKQFGQKMVDDHTKLGDAMNKVATQMNVKPPQGLSSKDKATVAKLSALNGDAFDKAYIEDMLKDHKQDEKAFKQEAMNTSNPALKDLVSQGAQMIAGHLQMVEQIAQKNNIAEK